jgi:hypothetical protein
MLEIIRYGRSRYTIFDEADPSAARTLVRKSFPASPQRRGENRRSTGKSVPKDT